MKNHWNRFGGIPLAVFAATYLPWLAVHLEWQRLWIAAPFFAANAAALCSGLLHWYNNWSRTLPSMPLLEYGDEPQVAVIIPCCGEPPEMIEATVNSVYAQDYPSDRLFVVVSDDAADPEVRAMVTRLGHRFPGLYYRIPARRDSHHREGDAKAGNLNSALRFLERTGVDAAFIETRDADDEVGDPRFMRAAVEQLVRHPDVAFVQTVKVSRVGRGDPFGNNNPGFYRTTMSAMHSAKAVYPCGSGLVWRRTALYDIGRFPVWNLVEDCDSGVLAMKRGWRGAFVPLVGAVGQTAPEDLPNVHKQRGTWAIDAIRLMFWRRLRGLSVRQRMFFYEIYLYYWSVTFNAVFGAALLVNLVVRAPLIRVPPAQVTVVYVVAAVVWLMFDYSDSVATRFEGVFRQRQMMFNLAPVFARAIVTAIAMGPGRKPRYRVTRKTHEHARYTSMLLPNIIVATLLTIGLLVNVSTVVLFGWSFEPTSTYFGLVFAVMLWSFVPRAWWGCGWQWEDSRAGQAMAGAISRVQRRMRAPLGETALSTDRPRVDPIEWNPPRVRVPATAALATPVSALLATPAPRPAPASPRVALAGYVDG